MTNRDQIKVNIPLKVPPQNLEAEQSVLGSLLLDKDAVIKTADVLLAEDFYRDDHAIIYQAILKLFNERSPIDVLTLTDILEKQKKLKDAGGASYLATLVNSVPSSAHVAKYAQIVHQKAVLRRLIGAASKITELGYQETEDIEVILDQAETQLFAVSQKFLRQYFTPIKSILSDAFDRIDDLHKHKGKVRGVSTGFKDLDNLLAGLQSSDLIILASRPSMGKTSLALNIAQFVAIKEKIPVGVFSLEQSKEQLVDRLLCGEAGVDAWKLRTGNLTEADFPKIGYAMGVLSEAPLYIDDSPMLNIMEIRTKSRRLQAEHGLGLIVVDYLQLMQGRSNYGDINRVQEISDISRGLKALARELDVPVVALSQLSRAVEHRPDKRPMLADLRESGCLAGDTFIFNSQTGRMVKIEKLIKKTNFHIIGLNNHDKLITQPVSKIFSTGTKLLFNLKLNSGKEIKATANHQFLTINGWKRLDKLSIGDYLATPRIINFDIEDNQDFSDNQIILLAHLIGDGCYLKHQPLHYTNSDQLCLDIVNKVATQEFSTKNKLVQQKNCYHLYLSAPEPLARGKRNPIVRWLDEKLKIYNQRSGQKIIPEEILTLSNKQIAIFIKHLFATDGSLTKSSDSWRLYYASNSKDLILRLQHLLLRFAIHSIIKKSQKKNYDPTYNLVISGATDQLKFLKKIGIFGKKSLEVQKAREELSQIKPNTNNDIIPKDIWKTISQKFQDKGWTTRVFHQKMEWSYSGTQRYKNGLSRERLFKIAQVLGDEELKNLANSDIFWEKIVGITPLGKEKVYDITVLRSHNFIANNIIVHNSIEQDADVVMFIYREDYYNPETERKGISEILIRKHRNGPIGSVELFFIPEQTRFRSIEKKITDIQL